MASNVRYFLALDEIGGGVSEPGRAGFFRIDDFDFQAATTGSGRATFAPLRLEIAAGESVAAFLDLAAQGGLVAGARLIGQDLSGATVYDLRLRDVRVVAVADGAAGNSASLRFEAYTLAAQTTLPGGFPGPTQFSGFDGATNSPLTQPLPAAQPDPAETADQPVRYRLVVNGVASVFEVGAFGLAVDATAPAGRAVFDPLEVVLPDGDVGAALFDLLATARIVEQVRLEGLNAAGATVYDLRPADVAVRGLIDTASEDRLTLEFGRYTLTTTGVGAATASTVGFDIGRVVRITEPLPLAGPTGNDDTLFGGAAGGPIRAGAGQDLVLGGGAKDRASGDAGDDSLFGGAANDQLRGGDGADLLSGEAGRDVLEGGFGDDQLFGGLGDDTMTGGRGNDTFTKRGSFGSEGFDTFVAGRDVDRIAKLELTTNFTEERFTDTLLIDFTFVGGPRSDDLNEALEINSTGDLLRFVSLLSDNNRRTAAEIDGADLVLVLERVATTETLLDAVILENFVGQNGLTQAVLVAAGADLL